MASNKRVSRGAAAWPRSERYHSFATAARYTAGSLEDTQPNVAQYRRSDLPAAPPNDLELPSEAISRRGFVKGAGMTGVTAATLPLSVLGGEASVAADGTPEQIHLTWGEDPSRSVVVSWVTPGPAVNPRVRLAHAGSPPRSVTALRRLYTDGMNGESVYSYHARLDGLTPDAAFEYLVTGDNDRQRTRPFTAGFRTAPRGRKAFRFTSFGDLSTPVASWTLSSPQSRHAVQAVERFAPLFHLLNGDLCYANLNTTAQPAVWADFGRNVQASAALRPWMPCPGNHEIEFHNGPQGYAAYLARYALPDNGSNRFSGLWYRFRVGSVLFVSLSADDVIYQDCGPCHGGPEPLYPAAATGNAAIEPGTSIYNRGYSGGAQTRWLEQTLEQASKDAGIDWIIVQMHQDALSSSRNGNGSDKGIREAWLPLFDRYGVDLVLCGHDHDYERSWPVRGCNENVGRDMLTGSVVDTLQPQPVVTAVPASGRFDTTRGTVHVILGGGGTSSPLDAFGVGPDSGRLQAKVITRPNRPIPGPVTGTWVREGADAVEDAIWSARRDTDTGYGIGVFDVDPGSPGGLTSITLRYYHAVGADRVPTANYELFETVEFAKPRRVSADRDPI